MIRPQSLPSGRPPSGPQRTHRNEYVMGRVPFQRPRDVDRVRPCSARPSTSGSATFVGLTAGAAVPSPASSTRAASPSVTRPASVVRERLVPQTLPIGYMVSLPSPLACALAHLRRHGGGDAVRPCEPLKSPKRTANE